MCSEKGHEGSRIEQEEESSEDEGLAGSEGAGLKMQGMDS